MSLPADREANAQRTRWCDSAIRAPPVMIAVAVILAVVVVWLLLLVAFGRRLHADWREPVLRVPVLIIESDDWGPGPPADAVQLQRLMDSLRQFRDGRGHPPVLTLGVVLAVPAEDPANARAAMPAYIRRTLDEGEFASIRNVMLAGRDAGVFALQLHGMEHFWPPALVQAAETEPAARSFLQAQDGVPRHESLPSHLQARWIDASRLPSVPLRPEAIENAVAAETACFVRIFGAPARVAVPVTFTWTFDVEAAWAQHGVRVVVTPGTRNVGRDRHGRLIGDGSILRNGDASAGGLTYVVRDIYFEPALGHTAEQTLRQIAAHHRLGRPALLETHRFNFIGDAAQAERSFAELRQLLNDTVATLPQPRFMSTEALAEALRTRDPALIDRRLAARMRAFVLRAATHSRLRKLAWISGLALVALIVLAVASGAATQPGPGKPVR